ncbi:monovalent cation/H(+) antiporter subunit G [Desulfoferrobacter suflitae]|uniref:monovalent cation/H(+) antiporter subunit G n=1 Tax=Desulfoferrobacter suflitae TaxID=2865782 RepID=UPI0021640048|nr:monovalent cation/H(+) antiporter subunit G [Desulfoferrobacter suflitae]MCK8600369.1 monovalent cation/H(+) antiporter subunit G [Desulfoferrobacter suflitae]
MQEAVSAILLIIGSAFMFIAGLGIVRMPDLFMRMSCATKASTLGVGFILLALAVHFGQFGVSSRATATIIFVVVTAPVAAHMIGRSAYIVQVPLWKNSIIDHLCDRYDRCKLELGSYAHERTDDPGGD